MKNIKAKLSSSGFSTIEIVIVVAVVAMIIGVGSTVYYRHKAASITSKPSTSQSSRTAANNTNSSNLSPISPANKIPSTTSDTTNKTIKTPTIPPHPQDPVPGYVQGTITIVTRGGANCGNHCSPPTPQPYQATGLVKSMDGTTVTSFSSASDGTFSLSLVPGTYTLVPQSYSNGMITAQQQNVTVTQSATTKVSISYDANTP